MLVHTPSERGEYLLRKSEWTTLMAENPDVHVMELKLYQNRLRVVAQELIAKGDAPPAVPDKAKSNQDLLTDEGRFLEAMDGFNEAEDGDALFQDDPTEVLTLNDDLF